MLLLLKICMLMMRRHTFFSLCFPLVIMIPQLDLQLAMVKVRLFPFKKFASEWSVTWLEGHVLCLLLLFFVCDHDFQACQIIRVSRLKLSFRTSNSLFYKKVIIHLTDIVSALRYRPDIFSGRFLQIVCSYVISKVQTNIQNSFSTFIFMLQQYLCQ